MNLDLSIIILARNEADNLKKLIPGIQSIMVKLSLSYEILIIDGRSNDETVQVAMQFGVRVVIQDQPGYGYAFLLAFKEARGDYVLNIDADCSHNPQFIKILWAWHAPNRMVIASRYIPNGKAEMPMIRRILSIILNEVYSKAFSLPYRDITSGFRLYHAKTIAPVLKTTSSRDFDVLLEVLIKLHLYGVEIIEVPFLYEPRLNGQSKVNLIKFGASYLKTFFAARRWLKKMVTVSCNKDRGL